MSSCCNCKNKTEKEKRACRMYIDYPEEDNCCLVSIEKNGEMTLEEVAKRLGNISFVRVQQIEKKALSKLNRKMKE